jgi:rRNA maturation RNase YbeY
MDEEIIEFHNQDFDFDINPLLNKERVCLWLEQLSQSYDFEIEQLNFIFCSDEGLLEINQEYLNHDYYTDIITFDLRDNTGLSIIEGDIFISIDRVQDNATTLGVEFKDELLRVLSHGVLHLIGFKDKSEEEAQEMRTHETNAIKLFHAL